MIDKLFSQEIATRVLYAYIALSLGGDVADQIKSQSPDLIVYRLSAIEKKIDQLEASVGKQQSLENMLSKHVTEK